MKKIYLIEKTNPKTAYNRRMYCPNCGNHIYTIIHQIKPKEIEDWWVECEECGYEGPGGPDKHIAIVRWKQQNEM